MRRLFFALWPSPDMRRELVSCQNLAGINGRLVSRHNLHATLCFLGEQPDVLLEPTMLAAGDVDAPPFTIEFDHFEVWLKPKVVSLCPTHVPQALVELQRSLSSALVHIGIAAEKGPYQPHITLARNIVIPQPEIGQPQWIKWLVGQFSLIESRLNRQMPVYQVLASWDLKY